MNPGSELFSCTKDVIRIPGGSSGKKTLSRWKRLKKNFWGEDLPEGFWMMYISYILPLLLTAVYLSWTGLAGICCGPSAIAALLWKNLIGFRRSMPKYPIWWGRWKQYCSGKGAVFIICP